MTVFILQINRIMALLNQCFGHGLRPIAYIPIRQINILQWCVNLYQYSIWPQPSVVDTVPLDLYTLCSIVASIDYGI